ncbi:threonine--tRNA ligase [Stratiformator vulcanicus]|uniref:Threonine--tRNA ligase n=1 Tax=Stratiformator vulcanicus TaxID=2527980 RepID=A0A517R1N5_9PLAN|nr:threonine--tRNA ligase [Stratiformator vulcanicus]QDT37753.1 Threonine--tRNA ligase [Stratiformator vulcanicus]
MIQIQLPDGNLQEHPDDVTAVKIAEGISERLAQQVVAAELNGEIKDATRPIAELTSADEPVKFKLLTDRDPEALGVLRHSAAHVMARAVMQLYEGVGLAFGPTTSTGFYYDFDLDRPISEEDFAAIEAEMKKIVKEAEPFEQFSLPRGEAVEFCEGMNQELKVEHINTGLAAHEQLGFYRQGEFVDLCRGPHIPHAGKIKAFKLLSVAGAHWKGDSSGKPLQRLYGTAFFDKKAMKAYLEQVEEAKKRDHRNLGKKLNLFHIDPKVGSGMALWLPKGATIRAALEDFLRGELIQRGYTPVYSPHLGRVELYETSGHFPYYRDSQFPPLFSHQAGQVVDEILTRLREARSNQAGGMPPGLDENAIDKLAIAAEVLNVDLKDFRAAKSIDDQIAALDEWNAHHERFLVKPMNCPHHCMMYKSRPHSYRELPIKLAEFGTVYRFEQSGELNGLLRVRGFTQDDAHIFCTPEQVEGEFRETLELVQVALKSVGLDDYRVQLSLRDPKSDKYVGSEENWSNAEAALRRVLENSGLNFTAEEGEAAFYGPKADFMVRDALGREWQLGTVQLDYNLPERFELEYIGSDNRPHRPVMIHRAPFGSLERFVGMLIEHFAGAFPLWLAPVQVRVLPLSEKSFDYAQEVAAQLQTAGFRTETDLHDAKLQAKIREAQLELIPYMFVVGPKEAEQGTVAVRDRIDGDLGAMALEEAIAKLQGEVEEKRIRQVVKSEFSGFGDDGDEVNEY